MAKADSKNVRATKEDSTKPLQSKSWIEIMEEEILQQEEESRRQKKKLKTKSLKTDRGIELLDSPNARDGRLGDTETQVDDGDESCLTSLMTDIYSFHMLTPVKIGDMIKNVVKPPSPEKVVSKLDLDLTRSSKRKRLRDSSSSTSTNDSCLQREGRIRYFDTEKTENSKDEDSTDECIPREPWHNGKVIKKETDPHTLARRQKQIDYGKNTPEYDRYIKAVPKTERKKFHPKTPPKYEKYSRRAFDGMVRIWRHKLHVWDSGTETRLPKKVRKIRKTDETSSKESLSASTSSLTDSLLMNESMDLSD